jgi:hypothetical protein
MDDHRFDALTRALSGTTPRRQALRLLGGGALAGLLTRLGANDAAAGCGKVGDKCERSGDCCTGARCKNGRCRCKRGWLDCDGDGRCEDHRSDEAACGSCTTVCSGSTDLCCRGTCVDPRIDATNCGRCGVVCPTATCGNGVCTCNGNAAANCPDSTCECDTRQGGGDFCGAPGATCPTPTPCPNGDADCPLGSACSPGCGCIAGCPV